MRLAACLIPASDHCGMCAMASLNMACSVCAALPAHLGGGASSAGGYSLVKCRLSRDQSCPRREARRSEGRSCLGPASPGLEACAACAACAAYAHAADDGHPVQGVLETEGVMVYVRPVLEVGVPQGGGLRLDTRMAAG